VTPRFILGASNVLTAVPSSRQQVCALAFHPRQPLLMSASGDGFFKIWVETERKQQQVRVVGSHLGCALRPDLLRRLH
jgi:WD40 repeat protein